MIIVNTVVIIGCRKVTADTLREIIKWFFVFQLRMKNNF